MRPLILCTGTLGAEQGRERAVLATAYVRAVVASGGDPLLVPSVVPPETAAGFIRRADGLLLTGGKDVDPTRYGLARHAKLEATSPPRDALEIALLDAARARRLPVLAICRGIQILNVALGGTLYQDLGTEYPSGTDHRQTGAWTTRTHAVRVAPDSLLARTLGQNALAVNSAHHQAIRALAAGLLASAWADDDLIEGVELPAADGWWVLGVQWHPEDLIGDPAAADRRLFDAFIARCRRPAPATAPA